MVNGNGSRLRICDGGGGSDPCVCPVSRVTCLSIIRKRTIVVAGNRNE